MENEINQIRNKAVKKIKALTFTIKQLELDNYNLELKSNQTESKYNSIKSRNSDLLKQIHDFKKNEKKFKRQLEQYDQSISLIKQHFQLDTIEEITNYIRTNIIDRKAELDTREKDLISKETKIEDPEIGELPQFLDKKEGDKPKRPKY